MCEELVARTDGLSKVRERKRETRKKTNSSHVPVCLCVFVDNEKVYHIVKYIVVGFFSLSLENKTSKLLEQIETHKKRIKVSFFF